MTDLHPHWHSTDDGTARPSGPEPEPGPAEGPESLGVARDKLRRREPGAVRIAVKPASRLPAAIAGIAVFTVIGITLAGGWQALTAQISGGATESGMSELSSSGDLPPVEIHIRSSDGFQPANVTVKPGQTIVWINDQSIPHILTSQTLRDGSGAYLNSPAIFPGATATFTVGPREQDGQHTITSTTDQTLIGTVEVSARAAQASSSPRKAPLGTLDGVRLPSGQGSIGTTNSSPSKSSKAALSAKLSSARLLPAAAEQTSPPLAPVDPQSILYANAPTVGIDVFAPQDFPYAASVIAPNTPTVREQPNTGPGLWAVCLMSIAVLWGVTRKYFRRLA